MNEPDYDLLVVGAGIVGLATARAWIRRFPDSSVVVIDKEDGPAKHQTGRNSGVIHSGIYYQPGSIKARATAQGRQALIEYCAEHGIAHELCGKVIVATSDEECSRLATILERGRANGVLCEPLTREALLEVEPSCAGVQALRVNGAGIVDFRAVCETMLRELRAHGARVDFGTSLSSIQPDGRGVRVRTSEGDFWVRQAINCAGLYSDRVALDSGARVDARIIPFRGEYFELTGSARRLCRHLIYPVPDPRFPFLGVHLTRMAGGGVEAGPNAVLAMAREGYGKFDIEPRELWWTLSYPGFWSLAMRHWRAGCLELWRSMSKRAFCHSLRRLVPELRESDLVVAASGVRAQAILPGGELADDFVIHSRGNITHVVNAPSPAATASLALAEMIVDRTSAGAGGEQ